ncbi:MAG: UTP--glucose-1-phosphate uridylyltransferase GalU [Candidatus Tectomicrobia bacterium]|uniref:UTP--glucose-1-phosphate uridylyltransferase n=1 Tax=Tectimicrobiota bacterium TaxID=2528274 RepID=A0A932HZT8_UNCTE|nr:UTP--glucose-1-phosphate uridylyltransferase GalU [Candidatus Tectomicrobia bacterium]
MSKVRKAVFPVAGLGTRFLPATKVIPKEMLPIVDTPQIQIGVQEALDAGIDQIVFITGRGKVSMVDHFDVAYELEDHLRKRGQESHLEIVQEISRKAHISSIRQKVPGGLGHAVLCAKDVVGDEPFAVILSDDLIRSEVPAIRQLADVQEARGGAVVAAMRVARDQVSKYGVVVPDGSPAPGLRLTSLKGMVEKPSPEKAPSDLAIIGRYILPSEIFGVLERTPKDPKGEVQLTDGIRLLLGSQPVYAYEFEGKRYDAGDKLGFLQATVEYALAREDLGPSFRAYLRNLSL